MGRSPLSVAHARATELNTSVDGHGPYEARLRTPLTTFRTAVLMGA